MWCNLNEKDKGTRKTVRHLIKKGYVENRQDAIRKVRELYPQLNGTWMEYGRCLIMNFSNVYYVLTFFG